MISWIVATHDQRILEENLLPTLQLQGKDELVLVENASSITLAYAEGQTRAQQPVRCYVHHDVRIFDAATLRQELIASTQFVGLVGVVGSLDACVPWWNGRLLGSVLDSRLGVLDYGPGGECAVVDGLLLATRLDISWDTDWPGWHGYDLDACAQVRQLGARVWCLTDGYRMIGHFSDSAFDLVHIDGWPESEARYRAKWEATGEPSL